MISFACPLFYLKELLLFFQWFLEILSSKNGGRSNGINEEIWKAKVLSKNSYANYVRVGDFGYFQKLDDKMSYEDGQAACHELHGKIIESDERNENATSKYSF